MYLNLLRKSSFVTIPTLYLLYLSKKNSTVLAKDVRNSTEPTVNENFLINKSPSVDDDRCRVKPLPNMPIIGLSRSKRESINLVEAFRILQNVPGVVCGVSYRGEEIWSFGNGLADIETRAPCTEDSVMRIASISKSITMLMLGKLLEQGKLDLDKPISQYLSADKFPDKYVDKQKVDITLRQLVSHLAGIRSYVYKDKDLKEFLLNTNFDNVYDSLKLFKDDDLVSLPGTTYLYTTHGYTLISAIIQSVLGNEKKFETELIALLQKELGMNCTNLDLKGEIVPNRAKYYLKQENSKKLINVPEVNNSYKWAGGGLLSNVHDLLKFANAMLYSYKMPNGVLKQETMRLFWSPNEQTSPKFIGDLPVRYGMGFSVSDTLRTNEIHSGLKKTVLKKVVYHTGGAVGVSSILLILPEEEICVAIMANSNDCSGIGLLAMNIAQSVYRNIRDIYEN